MIVGSICSDCRNTFHINTVICISFDDAALAGVHCVFCSDDNRMHLEYSSFSGLFLAKRI